MPPAEVLWLGPRATRQTAGADAHRRAVGFPADLPEIGVIGFGITLLHTASS